jgi:hypothetical protein
VNHYNCLCVDSLFPYLLLRAYTLHTTHFFYLSLLLTRSIWDHSNIYAWSWIFIWQIFKMFTSQISHFLWKTYLHFYSKSTLECTSHFEKRVVAYNIIQILTIFYSKDFTGSCSRLYQGSLCMAAQNVVRSMTTHPCSTYKAHRP